MISARVYGNGLTLPKRLSKFPDRLIEKYSGEVRRALAEVTPKRTSLMSRSWEIRKGIKKYRIKNPVPYARYVVHGVKKPIYPRTRKYLRFVSRGHVYYKRWVRGQVQKPIQQWAIRRARPTIAVALRKMLMEV